MMGTKIAMVVIITAGLFLFNQASWVLGEEPTSLLQTKEEVHQEVTQMKVKFYIIDRENVTKGEFVGTAELKEGKLEIDVADPKLEKILKEPYTTMTGEVKEGVARDWFVTYQPGTKEHLQAIAIECYKFGYIGEMVEE